MEIVRYDKSTGKYVVVQDMGPLLPASKAPLFAQMISALRKAKIPLGSGHCLKLSPEEQQRVDRWLRGIKTRFTLAATSISNK